MLDTPAAEPEDAHRYFIARPAAETSVADVVLDLQRGQNFDECHIAGAPNLPVHRTDVETTSQITKEQPLVIYCCSPSRNGATKAAVK